MSSTPPHRNFPWPILSQKSLLVTAFALLASSCSPVFSPVEQLLENRAILAETGRVYALVETQSDARNIEIAARNLGYVPQSPIDLDGLALVMVPVDFPNNVTGLKVINTLEGLVPSSTVGVNHAYRLQQGSSAAASRRSYANDLTGWPEGGCRAQMPIGLIDGGIDASAPVLESVTVRSRNFAEGSDLSRQHGTDVASVLADPTRLNTLTLLSANVIQTNETGEDLGGAAALVQAIDWLVGENVRLVNISLAGPPNKLLRQAIEVAQRRGTVIVAAVGNDGPSAPAQFPAALPDVIAVTALDVDKHIFRDAVHGPHVDLAAPGVDIYVPTVSGGHYVSGTSMAAPIVTAYLATTAGRNAEPVTLLTQDLGSVGRDTVFGYGLIQAAHGC